VTSPVPKVLVVADVPGWAWERKALAYQRHLSGRYTIKVAYQTQGLPDFSVFDLVHLFEVSQVGHLSRYAPSRRFKVVAGLTANVWRTWGAPQMHQWAAQVDALHANSLLLETEMRPFHPRVFYTPNGVDPTFFRRWHPHPGHVVFGHVGKPNPRKGGALIIEAARKAKVECRIVARTSKLAEPAEKMAAWYQGISVVVTASNMDGTPNPMLEGAATECALLSTPIGNMPEFIQNGYNGWLLTRTLPYHGPEPVEGWPTETLVADARDTDALRDALVDRMRWFADHPGDTIHMGRAARACVLADWTWERQVAHVATMWDAVLGCPPGPA
jgi:glycosyltransferase involved in cell wall biosynthesis